MPRMLGPVGASQRSTTVCATTTDCRLERFVVGALLGARLILFTQAGASTLVPKTGTAKFIPTS